MIQRIQTVYLLLVAVCMALGVYLPVADYYSIVNPLVFDYRGIGVVDNLGNFTQKISTLPLLGVGAVSIIIALVSISLYKNRSLQNKICSMNIFLILLYIGLMVYYLLIAVDPLVGAKLSLNFPVALPVIALIFNVLAMLRIKKDEELVRSVDRLR